jgi:hypothetical protein
MAPNIEVYFFGGYRSTEDDMSAWLASARDQAGQRYSFQAFHYRGEKSSATSAINGFGVARIKQMAAAIIADDANPHVIAGHSSGCAVSNRLATEVVGLASGKSPNIKLVALDGFRPPDPLFEKIEIRCWSAKDGGNKSRNWDSMAKTKENFRIYPAKGCGSKPCCLHFSLVNSKATCNGWSEIPHGYANCNANLCWLTEIEPALVS